MVGKKQSLCWALGVASVAVAVVSVSAIVADTKHGKFSSEAQRTAQRQRERILVEVKKLGEHEWAGEYYAGDGLGVNTTLSLAPDSGYVFEWQGCMGLYDRNYGTVAWADDRIRLTFTHENQRRGFQGIAPELIPISWGSRHYLVPADEITKFCNHVNRGLEPREGSHGFHLLRDGDEGQAVTGLPNVPSKYRSYLLANPIEAKIMAVGPSTLRPSLADWKFKDTPVTLDAGTVKGLKVGMELVVVDPSDVHESVEITKVDADHSEGILSQFDDDEQSPTPGWRLSTQSRWHAKPKPSGP
jgi:hypothetical protein